MKKTLLALLVIIAIGGAGYAYYHYRDAGPKFTVTTAPVTRGDVVDSVGATGTLQAVTTVQVGSQVSGTIQALYVDYNSLVKKGQVLARLDPSLFQTQIEQARANLIRAEADLERLKVGLDDARTKLARAKELSARQLIPKSELDTADVNVRSAEAQIRSSEAQVTQAQASLNQNQVNSEHTVITAPIDGLVISRSVDVGQTVAASMQAPTLFVLAADLTKMQVLANLDESDVGRIRPGQTVSFRVDAYPNDNFTGVVSQVRLEPKVAQNVVTYTTVIDVPNEQLKLKPGMTANVNIEIAKSTNVLRVPNAALRFRPTTEIFTALGLTPPDPSQLREQGGGGPRRGGEAMPTPSSDKAPSPPPAAGTPRPAAPASAPAAPAAPRPQVTPTETPNLERAPRGEGSGTPEASAPSRGRSGVNGDFPGGGRGGDADGSGSDRFAARMQNLTPEERERMLQRRRERGGGGGDPAAASATGTPPASPPSRGRGGNPGAASPGSTPSRGRGGQQGATATASGGAAKPATATDKARASGATTVDALFGPLPRVESVGRVWLYVDKQLKPVRLRLGISDGQSTELIEGDLQEGHEVVANVSTSAESRPGATAFPFGQPGRQGFPTGGFQGGGNRGGGGGGGRGGGN